MYHRLNRHSKSVPFFKVTETREPVAALLMLSRTPSSRDSFFRPYSKPEVVIPEQGFNGIREIFSPARVRKEVFCLMCEISQTSSIKVRLAFAPNFLKHPSAPVA